MNHDYKMIASFLWPKHTSVVNEQDNLSFSHFFNLGNNFLFCKINIQQVPKQNNKFSVQL